MMEQAPNRSPITRLIVIITTILVSFVGLVTLLGLTLGNVLFSVPTIVPFIGGVSGTMPTGQIAFIFVRVTVITLALTILVGVVNLVAVHVQRTLHGNTISARVNSAVLLLAFILGITAPSINPALGDFLLEDIQTTIESALAGLVFFTLVYGAFRMLKRQVTVSAILFVVTVEIVLIGAIPLSSFEPVRQFTDWLFTVPVNAGARGILLGIALATLITGVRVLIGQDRTYGE
ncbi:MAG: hypothetical protein ACFE0Q_13495 [Anaerolineae bacterium]